MSTHARHNDFVLRQASRNQYHGRHSELVTDYGLLLSTLFILLTQLNEFI